MDRSASLALYVAFLLFPVAPASAQDGPPLTAVLSAAASDESLRGTAGAIERVVRARVDPLGVVRVAGTPALNLADLQLAVGCMGETPECLSSVAESIEVEAMLMPTVDRAGEEIVVGVTFFDRRGTTRTERVVRRASGPTAEADLVDGVEGMLRELFGLPPPPHEEHGGRTAPPPESAFPVLGVVTMGVGVAAVGVGAIFGILSQGSADDFAAAPTGTMAEVDAALELRDTAESQATLANIFFIAGGAVVAAGAVLTVLGMGGSSEESADAAASTAWVAPILTPTGTYLSVGGSFGETW